MMDYRVKGTTIDELGWGLTPKEAIQLQKELAPLVEIRPFVGEISTVAAVDVSIRGAEASGAVVVVDVFTGDVLEAHRYTAPVAFPYVPGLLSFREIPALMPVIERLETTPSVFMCDGQGLAHPRRFGLACHLGVLLDVPAFGVAKRRLVGTYDPPGDAKTSVSPLMDGDEQVGTVVRTRAGVKPVFVSAGHRIDLDTCVALTLLLAPRFKMPTPARMAHRLSKDGVYPHS
jgi:deoxyribonuclease V